MRVILKIFHYEIEVDVCESNVSRDYIREFIQMHECIHQWDTPSEFHPYGFRNLYFEYSGKKDGTPIYKLNFEQERRMFNSLKSDSSYWGLKEEVCHEQG